MADRKKITLHRGILGVKYSYMCGAERGNNMKVLIFADSHGYNMAMAFAVDKKVAPFAETEKPLWCFRSGFSSR